MTSVGAKAASLSAVELAVPTAELVASADGSCWCC